MQDILNKLEQIEKKLDAFDFSTEEKGTIKKIDGLGRITIPIPIRRELEIEEGGDSLKVYRIGNKIIMEKMPN